MVFQWTAAFHRLSSYMVRPTKSLAGMGLVQLLAIQGFAWGFGKGDVKSAELPVATST